MLICCTSLECALVVVLHFHRFGGDQAITVRSALYSRSKNIQDIIASVSWMDILQEMCAGLEQLYCYQKVIHNDLKCDNVLASTSHVCIKAVIIDFGKARLIKEKNTPLIISKGSSTRSTTLLCGT